MSKTRSSLGIVLLFLTSLAMAQDSYFFPNNTFNPDNAVSSGCATALQAPIANCLTDVMTVATTDTFFPYDNQTYQDSFCKKACGTDFGSYVRSVQSACGANDIPFNGLPATYYGDFAWASWNLTCLQDPTTEEYCIDYFFTTFEKYSTDDTTEFSFSDLNKTDLCVPCTTLMYRQIQGTPFSNYDDISAVEWAAVQSKCGLSFPTTVPAPIANSSVLSGYNDFTPTSSCLSGNTYTVAAGDNVEVIAEKSNVSTGTLIVLNQLLPDGSDLQAGQVLCLPQSCSTYKVVANDTCYSIATAAGFTYTSMLAFNPTINPYCTNLIAGRTICISPPGGVWNATTIAGATATQTDIYARSTVVPPGPTASGTTLLCGKYYEVQTGDYCQLVALNNTIDLTLFEEINPSIDAGCTNLVPDLYYCVSPLESWNASASTSTTTTGYATAPAPTPSGTTGNCYQWYIVQSGNTCSLIESSYGITFAQLQGWNPSINSGCTNIIPGEAYCVDGDTTVVTTTTAPTSTTSKSSTSSASAVVPAPTTAASGTTTDCYKWYVVQSGNNCADSIDTPFGITFTQFRLWNPSVDSTCSNIIPGLAYCVSSPVTASKVKREPVVKPKAEVKRVQESPSAMGRVGNLGLPPKFPGVSLEYDSIAKGAEIQKLVTRVLTAEKQEEHLV